MRPILAAAALLLFVGAVHAQNNDDADDQSAPASTPAPPNGAPMPQPPRINPPKMPDMNAVNARQRKMTRDMLKDLRKVNPEAARQMEEQDAAQARVETIVQRYRQGRLDEDAAREQLKPLVEAQAEQDAKRIKSRIRALQAKIDYLQKAQDDHDLLVSRRVDLALGKTPSDARAFDDGPAPPKAPEMPVIKPPAR